MSHTAGPWHFNKSKGRHNSYLKTDNYWTIMASSKDDENLPESLMGNEQYYPWVPENEEDWYLIAAAPELLLALKLLLTDIREYQIINNLGGENNHSQVYAQKIIDKAEGNETSHSPQN